MKKTGRILALIGVAMMFFSFEINAYSADFAYRFYLHGKGFLQNSAIEAFLSDYESLLIIVGAVLMMTGMICFFIAWVKNAQSNYPKRNHTPYRSWKRIVLWSCLTVLSILLTVLFAGALKYSIREMRHDQMMMLLNRQYEGEVGGVYSIIFVLLIGIELLVWSTYKLLQSIIGREKGLSLYSRLSHPAAYMIASFAITAILTVLLFRTHVTYDMAIAGDPEIYTGSYARNEGKALIALLPSLEVSLILLKGWIQQRLGKVRSINNTDIDHI